MSSTARSQATSTARPIRRDVTAGLAAAVIGLLLATLPHAAMLARHGTIEYFADNDDVAYLSVAKTAYYGSWAARDPYARPDTPRPSTYAWLQFVPLTRAAAALGIPLPLVGLMWRTLGGLFAGFALFVLFRVLLDRASHPSGYALGCTVVCLADAGFVGGRTVVQSFGLVPHLLNGTTPMSKPDALGLYRVVTPLLSLPVLWILAAAVARAGSSRPTIGSIAIGALSLGTVVLLYFYFWTAAALALALLAGGLLLAGWSHPRVRASAWPRARFAGAVLVAGLLLGAPQPYANHRVFSDPKLQPTLERMTTPYRLPPGDAARQANVWNTWVWLKLTAGGAAVAWTGSLGLAFLWCLTLAAYLLANVAIVTGLEFQNYHWSYVHATAGAILLIATAALLIQRWCSRQYRPLVVAVPVAMLTLALIWRPVEALHAPDAVRNQQAARGLHDLTPALERLPEGCVMAGPVDTNIAVLYSRCTQLYGHPYAWSISLMSDEELHERHALNGWLQGLSRSAYEQTAGQRNLGFDRPVWRPQWAMNTVVGRRLAVFDRLSAAGDFDANGYGHLVLLRPRDAGPPTRSGPWRLAGTSESWALWAREGR